MYEFSLIDDQKFILEEILRLAEQESPDAIVIAIYMTAPFRAPRRSSFLMAFSVRSPSGIFRCSASPATTIRRSASPLAQV